ncbi:hypothetical protein JS565_10355 [Salmonella enterica subsp. enterica serovar Senftenberg]|nr:hypothetical protein [Salmonella enterica subsp. enterica serovar Senftenberg]
MEDLINPARLAIIASTFKLMSIQKIRVRADDSGLSVHKGTGQFSASKEVFKILGPQKIFITESDDGWWYGSYD